MSKRPSGLDPAGGMEPQRTTEYTNPANIGATQAEVSATATREAPDPGSMSGGSVFKLAAVPDVVPDGQALLIADAELPWLGQDGIDKGSLFMVSRKRADILIKAKSAHETFPPVWLATLDITGIMILNDGLAGPPGLGGSEDTPGDPKLHNRVILTRERPLRVSYEAAASAVERSEMASRAVGFHDENGHPISMVKIITDEQARNWDPDSLPDSPRHDPRNRLVDPKDRTPMVKFKALATCIVAGKYRVTKGEEREGTEWHAIMGCFLRVQTVPENPGAPHHCKLIGPLSEQGTRFFDAMQEFDHHSQGRWCMQSALPNYFEV